MLFFSGSILATSLLKKKYDYRIAKKEYDYRIALEGFGNAFFPAVATDLLLCVSVLSVSMTQLAVDFRLLYSINTYRYHFGFSAGKTDRGAATERLAGSSEVARHEPLGKPLDESLAEAGAARNEIPTCHESSFATASGERYSLTALRHAALRGKYSESLFCHFGVIARSA